jgi:hypothetical protein
MHSRVANGGQEEYPKRLKPLPNYAMFCGLLLCPLPMLLIIILENEGGHVGLEHSDMQLVLENTLETPQRLCLRETTKQRRSLGWQIL